MKVIDDFRGEYRFLSNFQASTVLYEGVEYPTVENAYQADKTLDTSLREPFIRISAKDAKKLGKSLPLRADWDAIKIGVMHNLVEQKFENHESLRRKLLDTGTAILIEGNWWNDTFWGVCRGDGLNMLGVILMAVRGKLKEKSNG